MATSPPSLLISSGSLTESVQSFPSTAGARFGDSSHNSSSLSDDDSIFSAQSVDQPLIVLDSATSSMGHHRRPHRDHQVLGTPPLRSINSFGDFWATPIRSSSGAGGDSMSESFKSTSAVFNLNPKAHRHHRSPSPPPEILDFFTIMALEANREALAEPAAHTPEYLQHLCEQTANCLESLKHQVTVSATAKEKTSFSSSEQLLEVIRQLNKDMSELDRAIVVLRGGGGGGTGPGPGPSVVQEDPPANTPPTLPPFNGDILYWSDCASSYLALLASIPDPVDQDRLLFEALDTSTRQRFFPKSDPTGRPPPRVYSRLADAFTGLGNLKSELKASFSRLPLLKNVYSGRSWSALKTAAERALAIINETAIDDPTAHRELLHWQVELVKKLLAKLPQKYSSEFADNFGDQDHHPEALKLSTFITFANHYLAIINTRRQRGQPTEDRPTPEVLCPICASDYHHPEQCEFDVTVRWEAIHSTWGRCRRCLVAQYTRAHACGLTCDWCDGDHHVALCFRKLGRGGRGRGRSDG